VAAAQLDQASRAVLKDAAQPIKGTFGWIVQAGVLPGEVEFSSTPLLLGIDPLA